MEDKEGQKTPELIWEPLNSTRGCYYRAKVPGGWLIDSEEEVMHRDEYHVMRGGYDWRQSITFIPDPLHQWYA
jgi:hypothetical protein